jgi:hypothetical protein
MLGRLKSRWTKSDDNVKGESTSLLFGVAAAGEKAIII